MATEKRDTSDSHYILIASQLVSFTLAKKMDTIAKYMIQEIVCPGCGLNMPKRDSASYEGYFNTSPECWTVFTEVLEADYSNAFLFGRVHQLTVDSYAVQHAGGSHPDKSVDVHLSGLYLVIEKRLKPTDVHPFLRLLVERVGLWPHFEPPDLRTHLTVCDVALASNVEDHIRLVREWSGLVWKAWSPHHPDIASFVGEHLSM